MYFVLSGQKHNAVNLTLINSWVEIAVLQLKGGSSKVKKPLSPSSLLLGRASGSLGMNSLWQMLCCGLLQQKGGCSVTAQYDGASHHAEVGGGLRKPGPFNTAYKILK